MDNLGHLEVIIKFENSLYEATCSSFPTCKGTAETKEAALKQLSQSIGRYISQAAQDAFSGILLSTQYTEVLLDNSQSNQEERRIFTLDTPIHALQKILLFKMGPIMDAHTSASPTAPDIRELIHPHYTDGNTISLTRQPANPNPNISALLNKFSNQSPQEGFVFGIPLSFN